MTPQRREERPKTAAATGVGLAVLGLGLAVLIPGIEPGRAQSPGEARETTTFEGQPHRYTVSLPAGCRHEEGPGTIDAVCAPDLDPEKSAVAEATGALVLAIATESLDGAPDTSVAGLLQRYTEIGFKNELPEAVCGEPDKARVKIDNLSQGLEGTRLVYTADVVCAEIRFLQIAARRARVRHLIGPDAVYRLMARAPAEEFERQRATIDAFFASFRLAPLESAEKTDK